MGRIEHLMFLSNLYKYKIIRDEHDTEYVVFENSSLDYVQNINDKTEFEAVETHQHLLDNIRKKEFTRLFPIAEALGKSVLCCLKQTFPNKNFVVFVSLGIHESFIIRFHQKWANEKPYYDPHSFNSLTEKVFVFEG